MEADDGTNRVETEQALADLHPSSFGWAMSCCRFDREEASDVLQASYLKILEGRARFNGHSSVRTWVFGVVRTTAIERRRKRFLRDVALARWALWRVAPDPTATPESASAEERMERRLRAMLRLLSGRQREMLHLVFYEEATIEEAARILGISIGTARIHYERGKNALRKMLTRRGERREIAHGRA